MSDRAYAALLAFAQERGARTTHSAGGVASYVWMVMELGYLCRLRGIETLTLTEAHATPAGLRTNRRKGSRDNVVEWTPRLAHRVGRRARPAAGGAGAHQTPRVSRPGAARAVPGAGRRATVDPLRRDHGERALQPARPQAQGRHRHARHARREAGRARRVGGDDEGLRQERAVGAPVGVMAGSRRPRRDLTPKNDIGAPRGKRRHRELEKH